MRLTVSSWKWPLDQQPNEHRQPMGHVIQELGSELDGRMCIELAIRSHGLPNVWPDAVSQEAAAIPDSVTRKDRKNRRDIRDLPLVTIDGASAKDFDDAVFCEPTDDGFRLLVAIADVSHYVTPGSALDTEAVERGTSAYFPGRVVPMLPTVLSNGICSLNPKVDRLCLVCDMHITADGKTRSSQFYPAVMHSHARLTYNQVWRAMGQGNKVARQQVGDLLPQLEHLFACYRALAGQRRRRGALEFDRVEPQLVLDGNGNVTDIKVEPRNDAHRLIEECMVAANVAAAKFIGRRKWPGPYRVHEAPQSTKLDDLMTFLHARGLSFPAKAKKIRPEHFAQILKTAKGRDDEALIQAVLLRSQSMAVYQPENNGHFGLALSHYAHFTSPIRRYPDLILHRLIKQGLNKSTPRMTERQMQNLCARCSTNERRAEDASRDATSRLQCLYLKRHIGDVFSGTITGVKGFGVFVELDEVYTSGLVHVTALPADYYHFDGNRHELVGEKRGKRFRLADRVRVEVLNVDVEESKVDLKIAK